MPPMDSRPHTASSDRDSLPSIPTYSSAPATLRCCCGRDDCALLEHNNVALEGLEKDLETAARLGQVRLNYQFDMLCMCTLVWSSGDRR